MVLSLSARGLTHVEISAHLAEVYGAEVSESTVSTITDKVIDGMDERQNRPLDSVYPVIFVDCVHVKLRDVSQVPSAAHFRRRLWAPFQEPKCSGRSIHGVPVWYLKAIASITCR